MLATMYASGLLISCATPAASVPTAAIRPGEDQLVLHPPAVGEIADEEVVALADRDGCRAAPSTGTTESCMSNGVPSLRSPVNLALDLLGAAAQIGRAARPRSPATTSRLPAAPDDSPALRSR